MARRATPAEGEETLILLDVDGVLNVGLHDAGRRPVVFTHDNLRLARRMVGRIDPVAQRLREVAARSLEHHGEDDTYEKLVADTDDLSELLVSRLARLIRAAGPACHVVLSSTWRNPQHAEQARQLENCIAKHLDRPFAFSARTAIRPEPGAMDRLECLGEYISEFCQKRASAENGRRRLRILVVDDFCATPLSCRSSQGSFIDCSQAAEDFLQAQAGAKSIVLVRVVHTVESWVAFSGNSVAVGCGLTMQHFSNAMQFLDGCCDDIMPRTPSPEATHNTVTLKHPSIYRKRRCSGASSALQRMRKRHRGCVAC